MVPEGMYPMENKLSSTSSNVSIGSLYTGMMRNDLRLPLKAAPMTKQYIIHAPMMHLCQEDFCHMSIGAGSHYMWVLQVLSNFCKKWAMRKYIHIFNQHR